MIVADTSLVAQLYFRGPHTAAAAAVHTRDADWAVPAFWLSEFRNVAILHTRHAHVSPDLALEAVAAAELQLRDRTFDVDSVRVVRLAVRSGCTAYDCEFVALAEELRVPLVTSDRQILAAFPAVAVTPESFTGA